MSESVTIVGHARDGVGKGLARKLRAQGLIPANLMEKAKSTKLSIDPKWLSKAWQSGKTFDLEFQGTKKTVRIHELQIHPVKRIPLHVDLMYV